MGNGEVDRCSDLHCTELSCMFCLIVCAFPLILYAPDAVQQQLFTFLLQYFDDCQTDG